ncbi:hypothetical protein Hanom_Chr05g00423341 [Helianthus anomalus]
MAIRSSVLYRVKVSSILTLIIFAGKSDRLASTHNIYYILDENYANMEPFKKIVPFLKESRIMKALTEKHKIYESQVRMFWKSVRYDEKEKTIYSAVQKKDENGQDIDVEFKFTMVDVGRVLDLKDSDDDPIIIPKRLSKGLWYRMGYKGHVNDKYLKYRFCRPYKFMDHCVVQALSHRKVLTTKHRTTL